MNIFKLIEIQYTDFANAIKTHLSNSLTNFNEKFGNNTIFGQLITVMESVVQNILLYIEDSTAEQNKYTAQRKKSIYSLAEIGGYEASLGKAAGCNIRMSFKPTSVEYSDMIIPNKTKFICSENGMYYNLILPQESLYMSIKKDNSDKYLYLIEGRFETQTFISTGGELYSQLVSFTGDTDVDYLEVYINDELWERADSLYDMNPNAKQYRVKNSTNKGIYIVFGNNQHGKKLNENDIIKVTYLIHSGELGNISDIDNTNFTFADTITDIRGEEIDGNEVFNISIIDDNGINNGTYAETTSQIQEMIGCNSRSFCLSDPKNYKVYINRFSFCGYNRTWCEEGTLVVNSLIMKNYQNQVSSGEEYFDLTDSDFILSDNQKQTIINSIVSSGQQLAGSVFNIYDPTLAKYALYLYVTLKDTAYDQSSIETQIRSLIGEFFCEIPSDLFIPKSDIIHLLKTNISEIDSVDAYFLSEKNEVAIENGYYQTKERIYNIQSQTYEDKIETVYLYNSEDPGLGLDEHGNIYLDNNDEFPVLMGGWEYQNTSGQSVNIVDPLTITFVNK